MRKIKWRPTKLIIVMAASVLIQMSLFGSAVAGPQSQPLSGAAQDATEFTSLVSHQNAAPEEGTFRGFYGEVAAGGANITGNVGAISLNLLYSNEQEKLTFTESQWGPNYKLELPAGTAKSDLADFLAPGSQVAVLAQLVNGEWTAVQVMPVPEAPVAPPTTGLVVGSNAADGTFTIVTSNGESYDLQLSPGVPAPAQGEIATVFREPRAGLSGQSNEQKPQRVLGVARASEINQRLRDHLQQWTGTGGQLPEGDVDNRDQHVASLIQILENHGGRYSEFVGGFSRAAGDHIGQAAAVAATRAEHHQKESQSAINRAREKTGLAVARGQGKSGGGPPTEGAVASHPASDAGGGPPVDGRAAVSSENGAGIGPSGKGGGAAPSENGQGKAPSGNSSGRGPSGQGPSGHDGTGEIDADSDDDDDGEVEEQNGQGGGPPDDAGENGQGGGK